MEKITVARLALADAHELAPLLAAYTQDRKRGAPREADEYYAERLLEDPVARILGARAGGRLVGFAVYLDLPDTMTGLRAGQLDDLFVIQSSRDQGVGKALVDGVLAEGARRGWDHLRWMVPAKPPAAAQLAEKLAKRGPWTGYILPVARSGG
ncbi:GNAT family N-acetyltransferase [soil metagenome]